MGHILAQDVKLQAICDCKRKFSCTLSTICPTCGTDIPQMVSPKLLEYSYHYDNRKKKSRQSYKSIAEKNITKELIAVAISDFPLSADLIAWSKANLYQLKDGDFQDALTAEINIEEDKKKYNDEKLHARAMLRNQQISNEDYSADLADIEQRYKHVSKKKSVDEVDWMSKLNEIASFSESIAEVLKNGSLDQKRKVLFALGSNLVWNEENLCITWSKSTQALIDGVKGMKVKLPEFEPNLPFAVQGLNEKTPLEKDVFSIMLPG
jgi:predicted nucleic-acid-binding protein